MIQIRVSSSGVFPLPFASILFIQYTMKDFFSPNLFRRLSVNILLFRSSCTYICEAFISLRGLNMFVEQCMYSRIWRLPLILYSFLFKYNITFACFQNYVQINYGWFGGLRSVSANEDIGTILFLNFLFLNLGLFKARVYRHYIVDLIVISIR